MTNFNESKLSKILARRVILPEDRSQLLPLSTPIYCPNNNGVRASRVTIINPQSNSFFTDISIANTVMIGCQYKKVAAAPNTGLVAQGSPVVNPDGTYQGTDTDNYRLEANVAAEIIYTNVTAGTQVCRIYNGSIYAAVKSNYTCSKLKLNKLAGGKTTLINMDTGEIQDPNYANRAVVLSTSTNVIDLNESTVNGAPALGTPERFEITKQPNTVTNTIDIDLTNELNLKYFVPHEVDLETDNNLIDIIKADFAAKFKFAVSNNIVKHITAMKTANTITTIEHGETLAETLGKVIADNIHNGTGQKFSIYRYNNGAPITYIKNSNQPDIDKNIKEDLTFSYDSIDDINIPALYYYNRPTLIVPEATLADYQTGLCNGTIKKYADDTINVDSAEIGFTQIGEGIFGTNDCFAVAFTEPAIKIADNTDFFGKEICLTINYGVVLVNKTNLRVIT